MSVLLRITIHSTAALAKKAAVISLITIRPYYSSIRRTNEAKFDCDNNNGEKRVCIGGINRMSEAGSWVFWQKIKKNERMSVMVSGGLRLRSGNLGDEGALKGKTGC